VRAKVLHTATALKCWIRTDRRWKRKALSHWSVETWVMRLPKSLRNCSATLLIGPRVSTAIGTKVYVCASCRHLAVFLSAAAFSAPPDNADVTGRYDCATMSVTVTSQVTLLPFCEGMRVSPSGLLPSDLRRLDGSLAAGMLAADSARQMRSFSP